MERLIDKTKKLIFTRQGGIFSSALILALMIIVSRVFGFLRYRILAGYFNKNDLDIYFASFRIPDLVFEILITGALTSTLIPIFIKYQKDKKDLDENISSIFNLIGSVLAVLIVIMVIFANRIIPLMTPGFDASKVAQIILYSQILLVGQLPLLVMGNFLTAIGQANKTFFLTAVAPVVYNLAIIVVTVCFSNRLYLMAPVLGVVVGALLFLIIQLPLFFKSGYSYLPVIKITKGIRKFFQLILPRIFSVIVTQIDATIDLTLTTLLGAGSYTIFYLAQHLQLLPVSVIGIAFGQASLPYLTEIYQENKIDELKKVITDSLLSLLFFTIPIMSFFVFARTPLVRLFFGGQKFDWDATVQTAVTFSLFSVSIPFHSIYYFLTRAFYALLDTKTPFIVSVLTIFINTVLSLYFVLVLKLPVTALAVSFSVSVIINVMILFIILSKKLSGLDNRFILSETLRMIFATLIPSLISYYLMKFMDGLVFDTSRTINVFLLVGAGSLIYFLLYLFLAWLLDIKEIYLVGKLFMKAKSYQKKIVEIYTNYE